MIEGEKKAYADTSIDSSLTRRYILRLSLRLVYAGRRVDEEV